MVVPKIEHRAGSQWCVVMFYDEAIREMGEFAAGVNLRYCQRQGYNFRAYDSGQDRTRYAAWSKIRFVRECLREFNWVCWIDADAVFTNHSIPLTMFTGLGTTLTICRDIYTSFGLNTGVFMVRAGESAIRMLEWVWCHYTQQHPWEQIALTYYALGMGGDVVLWPTRAFNSQLREGMPPEGKWQKGDFVAHAAGIQTDRLELLRKVIELSGCCP